MNTNNIKAVAGELSAATSQAKPAENQQPSGTDQTPLTDLEARLMLARITTHTQIPAMSFLFSMFGTPCFPRGELVAITGKAKSGKTFLTSVLMALCSASDVLSLKRLCDEKLKLLWFDTEQSEESTQDIMCHRLLPMIGADDLDEEQFEVYNVRSANWQERLPMLEAAIRRAKPDLVVLDGIRDLVNDINDGVMAQEVIERLMHAATEHSCCIVAVIHQNKASEDKNLRGWIGTELMNKAFEVYACEKSADRIFSWEQTHTRKFDILDKLKFTVDDQGIPHIASVEQLIELEKGTGNAAGWSARPMLTPRYVVSTDGKNIELDLRLLFADAMPDGLAVRATNLQKRVMELANITSVFFYNKQRERALADKIIMKTKNGDDQTIYFLQPQDKRPSVTQESLPFGPPPDEAPF